MKRMSLLTLILPLLICSSISARILNIPSEFPTIQAGIDSSSNGDTVLVEQGVYHEKIRFNGHNIILTSNYLLNGDIAFISSTIITWDSTGSIVTFQNGENRNTTILGFTIQGRGTHQYFCNGIWCSDSNPTISFNIIKNIYASMGGGIYCSDSDPLIMGNVITGCWAFY